MAGIVEHLPNPALALDEALQRVAVWDEGGSSTALGSRTRASSLDEQASGQCQCDCVCRKTTDVLVHLFFSNCCASLDVFLSMFSHCAETVAALHCLPSRMGCNCGEWDVMGDLHRTSMHGAFRLLLSLSSSVSRCDREVCAWR